MSLNDVLTNDESYQRQWQSLERGLVDALSHTDTSILPVSIDKKTAISHLSSIPIHLHAFISCVLDDIITRALNSSDLSRAAQNLSASSVCSG